MHCVVGTLQHTALMCSILSALLFLSLSLPPPSPEKTQGLWREEREKGVDGERERRKRKKRGVMQKRVEKRAKREKEITTPGVPRLSPTLVLTRPEEA